MWIIDNNTPVLERLEKISKNNKAENIETYDFEQLYTNIDLEDLKKCINEIIQECFKYTPKYLIANLITKYAYWSNVKSKSKNIFNLTKEKIISHINFLIDNIYISFCGKFYQQIKGIPMGTDCAPLLANLYLHYYEFKFLQKLRIKNNKLAKKYSNTYR